MSFAIRAVLYYLFLLNCSVCTEDEQYCHFWNVKCNQVNLLDRTDKMCLDKAIFYVYRTNLAFNDARYYCKAVFASSPYADLLGLGYDGELHDLKEFSQRYFERNAESAPIEVFTSAVCCPQLPLSDPKTLECKWYNGRTIPLDLFQLGAFINKNMDHPLEQCQYLSLSIGKNETNFVSQKGKALKLPMICTFHLPPTCNKTIDTPTTSQSSSTTEPTTTEQTWLEWLDALADKIDQTEKVDDFFNITEHLVDKINTSELKFQADIESMVKFVRAFQAKSSLFRTNFTWNQMTQATKVILESCDKIATSDEAWQNGKTDVGVKLAANVLEYVQYAGISLGCFQANSHVNGNEDSKTRANGSQVFLDAFNLDMQQPVNFSFANNQFHLTETISDPNNTDDYNPCGHKIGMGAVFLKLSKHLSAHKYTGHEMINSEIVAFNYNNRTYNSSMILPHKVYAKMRLVHHDHLEFGSKPRCVFWDFDNAAWNSEGCWIDAKESTRESSLCVCNHLTNFAVLMDVSGRETPSDVKNILTIVCTSASNICLIVIILMYSFCRELRNRRAIILINLSACLLAVNFLVLFGLDQLKSKIVCKSVSIVLLYSLLATFSWMLMEGYNLYQMIIIVFRGKGHMKTWVLFCAGYGVPALFTIISATCIGVYGELTSDYFCWISSSKYPAQMWAVAGPASVVMLINIFIIARVLRTVIQMNKKTTRATVLGASKAKSGNTSDVGTMESNGQRTQNMIAFNRNAILGDAETHAYKRFNAASSGEASTSQEGEQQQTEGLQAWWQQWWTLAKGYISLFFLVGMTWSMYVLYIHEYGHFFSYVFIVLNGLQGVFIFLTQVVINKKAKKAMRKTMQGWFNDDLLGWSTTTKQTTSSMTKSSMPTTTTNVSSRKSSREDVLNPKANNLKPVSRTTSVKYF